MLSFFPLDVFDEIWDVIESVSEGFLTNSCYFSLLLLLFFLLPLLSFPSCSFKAADIILSRRGLGIFSLLQLFSFYRAFIPLDCTCSLIEEVNIARHWFSLVLYFFSLVHKAARHALSIGFSYPEPRAPGVCWLVGSFWAQRPFEIVFQSIPGRYHREGERKEK